MNIAPPFYLDDPILMNKIRELKPAAIPPGFYLMMGDNRPRSSTDEPGGSSSVKT